MSRAFLRCFRVGGAAITMALAVACDASVEREPDSNIELPPSVDDDCVPLTIPSRFEGTLDDLALLRTDLIEGVLHLTFSRGGGAGGTTTYLARIGDGDVGELLGERSDLSDFTPWAHVSAARYARLTNGFHVEVMDATKPEDPEIVGTFEAASDAEGVSGYGSPTHYGAVGVVGSHVFYCRVLEDGTAELMSLDIDGPSGRTWGERVGDYPCREEEESVAVGSLWTTWGADYLMLWDLSAPTLSIVSHSYNPDGIHQYGPLVSVVSDGEVSVASTANDAYEFLFYRAGPNGRTVYASFGGGDKGMLGVVDGVAYFVHETSSGAHEMLSYDITNPDTAVATATRIEIDSPDPTPSIHDYVLDAHDATRLVVRDGQGQLFLIPREGRGSAHPFTVTGKSFDLCL